MNPIRICLIFTLALAAPSVLAKSKPTAEEIAAYQEKLFKQMDEDGDGKLTRREFVVIALYAVFEDQGPDRKGCLSKKKFIKTFKEETDAETEWAMMDTDKDGYITFEDVFKNKTAIRDMEAEFKKLDKSGRGYVTLADVQATN